MELNQTIVADKIMAEYFSTIADQLTRSRSSNGLTDLNQGTRATIKSIRTSTLYVFKRQKWRNPARD